MNLRFLLNEAGIPSTQTDTETEITAVTDCLDRVSPGALFVCIDGERTRGSSLIDAAAARGAVRFLTERPTDRPDAIAVENVRLSYSRLAAAFHGRPDKKLKLIGVTGTNGKTTTARYIGHLLNGSGVKCAYIGTEGVEIDGVLSPTGFTTPGADLFFGALERAVKAGCKALAAEVSSMALSQYRVHGAAFHVGVLTNVGTDHLDYHRTPRALAEAKSRLATLSDTMLVNGDDAYAPLFQEAHRGRTCLYSTRAILSDFSARNIRQQGFATSFLYLNGKAAVPLKLPTPGVFAVYNALAALAACELAGADPERLFPLVETLPNPPGRAQLLQKNGVTVCVDFAHTPEALSAILTALRAASAGRLIAVFGAGGDRDGTKRPIMGRVASSLADEVILTSDNPRHEDPDAIIAAIAGGARGRKNVFREPDRGLAIALALKKARPGDTVLIAGKGSETTQTVGDRKLPFSDLETVRAL